MSELQDRIRLESLIAETFPIAGRPASDQLVSLPFPFDPKNAESYTDDDAERVRLFFDGKRWDELVQKLPNRAEVEQAFVYLRPGVVRYFIPAFMLTVLAEGRPASSVNEALINVLLNPRNRPFLQPLPEVDSQLRESRPQEELRPPRDVLEKIQARWNEIADGLTYAQNRAIATYLNFLERYRPAVVGGDLKAILEGNPRWRLSRVGTGGPPQDSLG